MLEDIRKLRCKYTNGKTANKVLFPRQQDASKLNLDSGIYYKKAD